MKTNSMISHLGGVPLLMGNMPFITGNVFFVHGVTGNDANAGTKDAPLKTLDYAFSRCTANNDDCIILLPGSYETITGAGGITADVAGVSVIGIGNYGLQPYFLMDGAATVSGLVTAANVTFRNIAFKAGHADINYCFHITGKGCTFDSCRFIENVANENFVDVIHAGTADNDFDGLRIENCEFIMNDGACVTAIDLLKNSADVKILNNRITGDFDATPYAPIYSASTEVHTNILVSGNLIHNQHDDNAVVGISIANTASTGWILHNHIGHKDAAGSTAIVVGTDGLYVARNYEDDLGAATSGDLYPGIT